MLERRFHPNPEESHSIDELRTHLAERYSIPTFELNPMLEPLLEIENYVNTNLQVSEDRLRFFFAVRAEGPVSLALFLYHMLRSRVRFSGLNEAARLKALTPLLSKISAIDPESLAAYSCHDDLFRFLLRTGCTEEIKGLCIALYYSIDEYLDELDVILRKATALFLEHLPDMSAVCHQVMQEAQQKAGDNPFKLFGILDSPDTPASVTMCPSIMGFHRLHWDFSASAVYVGIYYQALANLVQKYSDPCASLYSRLKSMSDKSRLEIFRILKASEFNGLDLSEKLGLAPTTISYHMNMLVREGFVSVSKRGTGIYYTLNTASLRRFVQELEHFLL